MAIANLPKLNFSVPFAMTSALPVEYNAYFGSYEDAVVAAGKAEAPGSSTTIYYYGQKIVVVGETEAKLYIIQPDKTLKEAGGVPIGQDGVITISDTGEIGIYGVNDTAVVDGYQPRIKVVDGKKTIEWYKPDTTTVSGLQSAVKTLQDVVGDSTEGLVKDVNDIKDDISDIQTDITNNVRTPLNDVATKVEIINNTTIPNLKTELEGKISTGDTTTLSSAKSYTDEKVAGAIASVYKPAGTVAFADLPALSEDVLGNVYNVSDAFTTTASFVEGAGKTYPAGTNVVVVKVGDDYKFDVLSGMVDLSDYAKTTEVETAVNNLKTGITDGTVVAKKAEQDGSGNVITTTYATKTEVQSVKNDITSIMDGTNTVDKASKDGDGNVINNTYATKDELNKSTYFFELTSNDPLSTTTLSLTKEQQSYMEDPRTIVQIHSLSDNKAYEFKLDHVSTGSPIVYVYKTIESSEEDCYGFAYYPNVAEIVIRKLDKLATESSVNELETKVRENTTAIEGKVSKETGKGLSTNDFTTALKDKLTALPEGAQVNAIDTVNTDEFTLSEDKELGIKAVDKSKITGLQTALDTKLENVSIGGTNLTITNKTVAIPGATATQLGLVKSSAAQNGVAINADFTMTVNSLSTDKLFQGANTIIWNGGGAGA